MNTRTVPPVRKSVNTGVAGGLVPGLRALRTAYDDARLAGRDLSGAPEVIRALADSPDERLRKAARAMAACGTLGGVSRAAGGASVAWGRSCDRALCQQSGCLCHRHRQTVSRLEAVVLELRSRGVQLRMVTLTLAHTAGTWASPRRAVYDLHAAFGRLKRPGTTPGARSRGFWGYFVGGAYSAAELTYSAEHGWHPHLHVLVAARDGRFIPQRALRRAWGRATGGRGRVVDVRAVRDRSGASGHRCDPDAPDSPVGPEPLAEGVVREVVKYVVKGSDLRGDPDAVRAFARTMRGVRLCRWHGEWLGWHPEWGQSDDGRGRLTIAELNWRLTGQSDHSTLLVTGTGAAVRDAWCEVGELVNARTVGRLRPAKLRGIRPPGRRGDRLGGSLVARVLALAALPLTRCEAVVVVRPQCEDDPPLEAEMVGLAWRHSKRSGRRRRARYPGSATGAAIAAAMRAASDAVPF